MKNTDNRTEIINFQNQSKQKNKRRIKVFVYAWAVKVLRNSSAGVLVFEFVCVFQNQVFCLSSSAV